MKTLIIFFALLGVVFFYFIANTEKSVSLIGDEVTPTGVDIKKFTDGGKLSETISSAINGLRTINGNGSETIGGFNMPVKIDNLLDSAKKLKDKAIDKAENLIKNPIENKTSELFCPQK